MGSVYWNDQCGIVRAFARNAGATPPWVVKSALTSLPDAVVPADADVVTAATATIAASAAMALSTLRFKVKIAPSSYVAWVPRAPSGSLTAQA